MQTDQITAALDAANIRHTPEAVAMLAECNAEPDWEQYREALDASYFPLTDCVSAHPYDGGDKDNISGLIAAHPHMPETKAMQARIAELEKVLAAADRMAEACAKALPDPDGWIDWHAGECPVGNEVKVEMKLRNGRGCTTRYAKHWRWSRAGEIDDIIAYRVLP